MKEKFVFTALGGLEEIGLNCYLYGAEKTNNTSYLMLDLGLGFRDYKYKFLDSFIPDISLFKQSNKKLEAILFTHGHEDHIGALEYYANELIDVPVYATPLTADLIRNKLETKGLKLNNIIEVEFGRTYSIADFKVIFLPIEHSIPEASMIYINYNNTSLVHSGDFKINLKTFKPKNIQKLLPSYPKYLFCDSTNCMKLEPSKSEDSIINNIYNLVNSAKKDVWITFFSSNIERLNNIIEIAAKCKRKVVFFGRSVKNYYTLGSKHNYIYNNNIIPEDQISNHIGNLLYVITGSQGEERSFLYNILFQGNKSAQIRKGDTFIFSSKIIPGNEVNVSRLRNALADLDINVISADDGYDIHVSGHPSFSELKVLYKTLKPEWIIPIHGERMHLHYHKKIVEKLGFKSLVLKNGEVINLLNKEPNVINVLETSKLHYEGGRNISIEDNVFKERRKLMFDGTVNVSLVIQNYELVNFDFNSAGILLSEELNSCYLKLKEAISNVFYSLNKSEIKDYDYLKQQIKTTVKKFFFNNFYKKPLIFITIFEHN